LVKDEEGRLVCPSACGKAFKSLRSLNKHVISHKLSQPLKGCPHCSEEFSTLEELHRHIKSLHINATANSNQKKSLKSKRKSVSLSKKKKRKTSSATKRQKNSPSYTCSTCAKVFLTYKNLQRHLDDKEGSCNSQAASSACETCGKQFSTLVTLKRHMRDVHLKTELDFSCPECGEVLGDLQKLTAHWDDTHGPSQGGSGLNFCEKCGKTFLTQAHLNLHLRDTHKVQIEVLQVHSNNIKT